MKKPLSNSEKWSQRIGYLLTILVLIDCFTRNALRRRTTLDDVAQFRNRSHHQHVLDIVDTLGKFVNGKNLYSNNNEFGLEITDHHAAPIEGKNTWKINRYGSPSSDEKIDHVQSPNFHQNLTVFILPDLRRTTNGNENGGAVASNQELSLQDSDAIDFYWRQDIDAEKGVYPTLWSPDLQYERDVQLVTEKTLLQPNYVDPNFRVIDQSEFLRDLLEAQKDYFTFHQQQQLQRQTYQRPSTSTELGDDKSGAWQLDKAPFVFETTSTTTTGYQPNGHQQQQNNTDNAYGGELADLNLDFSNSTNSLLNDVFFDTNHLTNGGYAPDQGQINSEYNYQGNDLNTPPNSMMDWESKPDATNDNRIDDTQADPMLFNEFFTSDFDNLPTPDLSLAPIDVARLFSDRQVAQDVADAQTTKDMMLHHSPIAPVDAFPLPLVDSVGVVPFVPTNYDENNYLPNEEQSEVILETLQPYNDPFSAPTSSWMQPAPYLGDYNVQQAVDTTGITSPTWTGDHDYVLETVTAASGDYNVIPFPNHWPTGDENWIKSESTTYDDDEEEDDDVEEDSSEQRARAASERDELRARQLQLPYTAADIVKMAQSDYVGLTRSKGRFTREQIELMKEIRRHGGNKEAARRSRQKKVQMSMKLEDEVKDLERQRNSAMVENKKLLREIELEERAIEEMKRKNLRK